LFNADEIHAFRRELKGAQFWFTVGEHYNPHDVVGNAKVKVVMVPHIHFEAFHPDITYAHNSKNQRITKFHYNSMIGLWCYKNKVSIRSARSLFSRECYANLGYFTCWHACEERLRSTFLKCGFSQESFLQFFSNIKRTGNFMHSINHPQAHVSVRLAKHLLYQIDPSFNQFSRVIIIEDPLTEKIWPLYPEIGEALGVEGNYYWRINNQEIFGVEDYLSFVFESYADQQIMPQDLMAANQQNYLVCDKILKKIYRRS